VEALDARLREQETKTTLAQDAMTHQNTRESELRRKLETVRPQQLLANLKEALRRVPVPANAPPALQAMAAAAEAAVAEAEQTQDQFLGELSRMQTEVDSLRSDQGVFMGRWQTILSQVAARIASAKMALQRQEDPGRQFAMETLDALSGAEVHGINAIDTQVPFILFLYPLPLVRVN
jgi:hypothetical protein